VQVLLHNSSDNTFHVYTGDCIAQFVIHHIESPAPIQTTLPPTTRGDNGFGRTGYATLHHAQDTQPAQSIDYFPQITSNFEMPRNFFMSQDPFDTMLTVHNPIKGDRQTLGMLTQYCPH